MCVAVQMRQAYGCLWKLDKKNNDSWDKNIAQDCFFPQWDGTFIESNVYVCHYTADLMGLILVTEITQQG